MAITVTAQQTANTGPGMILRVLVLTNCTASQTGNTGSVSGGAVTPQVSVTPTFSNSRFYAAAVYGNSSGFSSPSAATTAIDNITDATNGESYGTCKGNALTTAAVAQTIGWGGPTSPGGGIAVFEIAALSGTGPVEDASAPALVNGSGTSNTSLTTAAFTPPAGSLLVALVSTDGGTGIVTVSVSDTSGLSWTEKVAAHASSEDYAGVWIAQVPAAAGGTAGRPGRTWLRQFRHRQTYPYPAPTGTPIALADSGTGTDTFSAGNVSVPLPALVGRTWRRQFDHRQQPLYTSTFSIAFTDSGAGTDTLSAGNVSIPLPAIVGRTWRRQFDHRQSPLYTSTFSEDFADSGTGTDAFAPGIATAYPFPPATPGQSWLRQFKHRQQPVYTSTFSVDLADSGTGTDAFTPGILNPPLPAVAGRTWRRQFDHRQTYPYLPFQANVSAIGLTDSGTGTDTFSAAIINPPLPAIPGQTWLRNFKHRQQPLYTSTFSENFSDSGSGTDTLAPGIATAYPFPPAVPGRTWQRQFKHIQQALYTSTYSRDLTDSGAGTDTLTPGPVFSNPLFPATPGRTWARQFKHPQTYPYLPVPANTFNIGLTDSGTGTDTFAASISTTLPLTLRTGKTWFRQFKHPQIPLYTSTFSEDFSDSGAGTDTLAITSGVALSDTGAGTDTLSPGILNPPLPAVFGKTWQRAFKHRQAPLYTSTFSENLADSGAGADVLGVTVTAVFPIPVYSRPGKTWLRRYKHRQTPLYTLAYSINPARQAVFAAGQPFTDWQLGLPSTDWQTGQISTDWQLGLVSSR